MTQALAPAGVSHYYRRLAELSTLPFWQLPDITEPSRPKRGHVWHWPDIYPELARSRDIADDAAVLQRRALILCNPGLTPPAAGAAPTIAAAYQMLFPGESPRPRPFRAVRPGWQRSPHEPQMPVCWEVSWMAEEMTAGSSGTPSQGYLLDNAAQQTGGRFSGLDAGLDQNTQAHLSALGIAAGWRCLEAGAGSGSIARWMAERVGAHGHVLATDIDTRWIQGNGLSQLEVQRHDVIADPLAQGELTRPMPGWSCPGCRPGRRCLAAGRGAQAGRVACRRGL